MSYTRDRWRRRTPTASPAEVAAETAPFPLTTIDLPMESSFPDWRRRLTRNLARRSDSRWEPLTWVHARVKPILPLPRAAMSPTTFRAFAEHRDTRLWLAIQESIDELVVTPEISVNTAGGDVAGVLRQELVAGKLIASADARP